MKVFITNSQWGKDKLKQAFRESRAEVVHAMAEDVNLIVPTVDEELPTFAASREWFQKQGVTVAVASPNTIKVCRDKAEFYRFCIRCGFGTPKTMQENLIAKPRFGKGSKNQTLLDRNYIIQEYVSMPEYSIDYFKHGNVLSIIPRRRLNVVNGESQAAEIIDDPILTSEAKRMGELLGLEYHNVMQCFYDGYKIKWIEVNPRYGGGSWLTFNKFNSPEYLTAVTKEMVKR